MTNTGDHAFIEAVLVSLTIPDNILSIGEGAFQRNSVLTLVKLGTGLVFGDNTALLHSFVRIRCNKIYYYNVENIDNIPFET